MPDYQVLHDAFFKHQTKPRITSHGDIYYENKEYESCAAVKDRKPGQLSARLLEALGVDPAGPVARNLAMFCPPWLMNQQRYGPPPSYPKMKIPGLNAPIPTALGARYGYHPGDWGKPPVDEYGRPLYGDAFGTDVAIDEGEEVVEYDQYEEVDQARGRIPVSLVRTPRRPHPTRLVCEGHGRHLRTGIDFVGDRAPY